MIRYSQSTIRQRPPEPKMESPAPKKASPLSVSEEEQTRRDSIIRKHWPGKLTAREIADLCGYNSHGTVINRAKALGLPARSKRRRS